MEEEEGHTASSENDTNQLSALPLINAHANARETNRRANLTGTRQTGGHGDRRWSLQGLQGSQSIPTFQEEIG